MLLTGRSGRRNPKQSMCQRLVLCKNSKLSTFKHKSEAAERIVSSEKFTVEGGGFLLCVRELLGKERQWSPRTAQELLQNYAQVSVRSIHRERDRSIRLNMNKFWNEGEKILGSGEGGVQSSRPGPLRAVLRGPRTLAAPLRNFLQKLIIPRNL